MSTREELPDACRRLARNDPTLTLLNLNHGGIGNIGLQLLAASIQCDSALVVLFLNGNDLTDDGIVALLNSLSSSKGSSKSAFKHLYMSNNSMGPRGASALSSLLRQASCSLQVLKLSHNRLCADGARALGHALPFNTTLRVLNLQGNGIEDAGAKYLAAGLESNTTLQQLDLRHNCLSKETEAEVFLPLLRSHNKTLHDLWLFDDESDEDFHHVLVRFYLHLNRIGRNYFGDVQIPQKAWPRVLSQKERLKSELASSLIYAALQARPDMVVPEQDQLLPASSKRVRLE